MSTEDRLARLGLLHLRDKPEELRRALEEMLAPQLAREKADSERQATFRRLQEQASDADWQVRCEAARRVGELEQGEKNPWSPKWLITLLRDPEAQVRRTAAAALGKLQNLHAVEHLLIARQDTDPGVREAAQESLSRLKEQALRILVKELGWVHAEWTPMVLAVALDDRDAQVRLAAVESICRCWDYRAEPFLYKGLVDPDPAVQQAAQAALASFKRRYREPFPMRFPDFEQFIKTIAMVGEIGDARVIPLLKKCHEMVLVHETSYTVDKSESLAQSLRDALAKIRQRSAA